MCKIKKSMFLEQYILEQEVVQCFDHNDKVIEVKKDYRYTFMQQQIQVFYTCNFTQLFLLV